MKLRIKIHCTQYQYWVWCGSTILQSYQL